MSFLQTLISILKAAVVGSSKVQSSSLLYCSLSDYQESNLANYLSGCCLSNIY